MSLTLPKPHAKQAEFISDTHRFKVLNWGRRCFSPGTLISMADGTEKPIEAITPGESIISYNRLIDTALVVQVEQVYNFGVDTDPKPMVSLVVNGKTNNSTYDHEYYIGNQWVSAIELAWGVMAPSERQKFQLLCKQYGTALDDELQGRLSDQANQTSTRRFWVFKDGSKREDDQGTQSGCRSLGSKPTRQTTSKPQGQRSNEQPSRQPGARYSSGESTAHDESGQTVSQLWGEKRNAHSEGEGCHHDYGLPGVSCRCFKLSVIERAGSPVSAGEAGLDSGYFEGQDLEISSATVGECQETYDLGIPDHHNYVANGVLVHNTGKSVAVWEKVVLEAMLRQGTYYIVGPTYKQTKEIYWQEICKRYRGDFMTFNEQELSITFDFLEGMEIPTTSGIMKVDHNPDLPPSRIILKGADNPDALRGVSLSGCVMDEYAFMPKGKELFDEIVWPALADKDGWAVFISTPNGVVNHFYDLVKTAQEDPEYYFFSHATAMDNDYFPQSQFSEARHRYEKEGKLDQFNQEWMAEFVNPTQLVYGDFSYDTHVFTDLRKVPEEGSLNLSIDFGMTDPTAAIFVKIDYDGNWWVIDEFYKADTKPDQLVDILRDKMGYDRYTRIIGDSRGKFEMEFLRKRHFRITAAKKGADSVAAGIKEVRALLAIREGTGKPKLFVHKKCVNTIKEFERYSFERASDGTIMNTPEDDFNHAMDAIRYLALDKAKPVKKEKRKREYDPVTGRPLN